MAEFWSMLDGAEKLYVIATLAIIPVFLFGLLMQFRISMTFKKYDKVSASNGKTAREAAKQMLADNEIDHVAIEHTSGKLSDHYDPRHDVIRLSDSTYDSSSMAAIGVACHEAGHAVQHNTNYAFSKVRKAMVPVVNIASRLYGPIIIVGLILCLLELVAPQIYNILIIIGFVFFGLSTLFMLITLPTEFNASHRALESLRNSNDYSSKEIAQAKKVLNAAAMTYVAAFLMSLVQFLRYLARILMLLNSKKK